jgi:hypothetical protein
MAIALAALFRIAAAATGCGHRNSASKKRRQESKAHQNSFHYNSPFLKVNDQMLGDRLFSEPENAMGQIRIGVIGKELAGVKYREA